MCHFLYGACRIKGESVGSVCVSPNLVCVPPYRWSEGSQTRNEESLLWLGASSNIRDWTVYAPLLGNGSGNTFTPQRRIVWGAFFYAVRVVSTESKRLVLIKTSCFKFVTVRYLATSVSRQCSVEAQCIGTRCIMFCSLLRDHCEGITMVPCWSTSL
jgi:hypothetical protein